MTILIQFMVDCCAGASGFYSVEQVHILYIHIVAQDVSKQAQTEQETSYIHAQIVRVEGTKSL